MKDLLPPLIMAMNTTLNIMALYGYFVILSTIILLPVLLGWEPEINGVTHHLNTDSFFDIKMIILNLICVVLSIWVCIKSFFPVFSLIKSADERTEKRMSLNKMKSTLPLFLLFATGSALASGSVQLPIDKIKYVYEGDRG